MSAATALHEALTNSFTVSYIFHLCQRVSGDRIQRLSGFHISLTGASAALEVLRTISILLFTDILRQLNNLRDATFVFLQTIYLLLVDDAGVSKQMSRGQREVWEHVH